MPTKRVLVTGSSGLIGSEAVLFFDRLGWDVHGIDNNMRRDFFGPDGDTAWNLKRLQGAAARFTHHDTDMRDRESLLEILRSARPDLIVHCAAQPSHDLAKDRAFDDFDVNAVGTLNLLESVRRYAPDSPFVFMSTNKVYGDRPNLVPVSELETRYDYTPEFRDGIDETCPVDTCTHSIFGASKLAADVMVQEYGRYFGIPTVCFRAGCLTGPNHSGVELHGFLAYLAKAVREGRPYRIYGYKGKQVRDNLHSFDVCAAMLEFYRAPRPGAVYNLGGGRDNSVSLLEAVASLEALTGRKLPVEYVDRPRVGDHICYITNLGRFRADYPEWKVSRSLESILQELAQPALKART